jgi:hypothetical protein
MIMGIVLEVNRPVRHPMKHWKPPIIFAKLQAPFVDDRTETPWGYDTLNHEIIYLIAV